ncbi:MAG TPA: hypothetical protein VL358_01100 [Caulobacteraceae bacterium]|jgi:hypothetical protein|nr:hypothetical protein [Caulobacteraceae bacterium]
MIALLLTRWRLVAAGAAVLAVVALLVALQHEHAARAEAERRRAQAVAQAAAAAAQAALNQTAGAAAVQADARAVTVTTKGQEAAHAILSTSGADARLPDAVRAAWLAGIVGVRQPTGVAPAVLDHPGG